MNKNQFFFLMLVFTVFFSLIMIVNQNKNYQNLQQQQLQIKKLIHKDVILYKENIYNVEKERIKRDNKILNKDVQIFYVQ